MTYIKILHI